MTSYLDKKWMTATPHELIPISFMLSSQTDNHFYQITNENDQSKTDRYSVLDQVTSKSKWNQITGNTWCK